MQSGAEEGAGVRVVSGDTTYFAHVDGLDPADLERAAAEAASALRGERAQPRPLRAVATTPQPIERRPEDVPAERKAELLRELDERGRAQGGEVVQFSASYAEARREVTVANSDGLFSGDDRTRVRLGVQAVARRAEVAETGFETLGGHRGFELLDGDPARIAEQAARKALTLLDADPAPAGAMPVVVGGGFGGVLFHEMTGHGLEADHVQKGACVYAGKLGEQVAQSLLNAYDDGRLAGRVGHRRDRRRGRARQRTLVIDDGRITSYLYDLIRADRDGVASTGNGRRESFRHLPIPRMTNTYIAPGEAEPEEMIAEVESGFYAVSFAGGQVDPATGDFVFGVSEGYLIEGGRVTKPCRGATLIGNCLDALAEIDAVACDFEMKTGFCGKGGQKVPVGTGQGHVRIGELTVGGRRSERARRGREARRRGRARSGGRRRRGLRRRGRGPRDPGLRRRGREPHRRRRARARAAGLDRRPRRLRLRHRPHRGGRRRDRRPGRRGGEGRRRRRVRGPARPDEHDAESRRPRRPVDRRVVGRRRSSWRRRSSAPRSRPTRESPRSSRSSTPTPPSASRSPPRPASPAGTRPPAATPTCRRSPRATATGDRPRLRHGPWPGRPRPRARSAARAPSAPSR